MCSVLWSSFSWEAFATLVTGLAAVAGAVFVATYQSKIIKRQVDLQYISLKHDLYDRRMAAYQAIEQYSVAATHHTDSDSFDKNYLEYSSALRQSRFLFPSCVYKSFEEADSAISYCKNILRVAENPEISEEDSKRIPEELNRARMRIFGLFAQFPELLAPFLSLAGTWEGFAGTQG